MKKELTVLLSNTKENGDCLEWTKCLNTDGYPRALIDGDANAKVHRVVYELFTGENISGYVVRHICDNPRCINPHHLEKGTPADNVKDRDTRERNGKAKLSHKDVRAIRELWGSGIYLQKELGKLFKVDPRTISSIVNRHHFKYVE